MSLPKCKVVDWVAVQWCLKSYIMTHNPIFLVMVWNTMPYITLLNPGTSFILNQLSIYFSQRGLASRANAVLWNWVNNCVCFNDFPTMHGNSNWRWWILSEAVLQLQMDECQCMQQCQDSMIASQKPIAWTQCVYRSQKRNFNNAAT